MFVQRLRGDVGHKGLLTLIQEAESHLDVHHLQLLHYDEYEFYSEHAQGGRERGFLDLDLAAYEGDFRFGDFLDMATVGRREAQEGMYALALSGKSLGRDDGFNNTRPSQAQAQEFLEYVAGFNPLDRFYSDFDQASQMDVEEWEEVEEELQPDCFTLAHLVSCCDSPSPSSSRRTDSPAPRATPSSSRSPSSSTSMTWSSSPSRSTPPRASKSCSGLAYSSTCTGSSCEAALVSRVRPARAGQR